MRITTDRLVLREYRAGDWPAVLGYQRDPRYLRLYSWTERTEADARAFVQGFLDEQAASPRRRFQLAITLPASGALIGSCGIRRKEDSDREADIGFELDPEHWGHGYATEAAPALTGFGSGELKLHRISSWCVADNSASVGVLRRTGLRQEGRLRENEHFKGRWWDTLLFELLETEWRGSGAGPPER